MIGENHQLVTDEPVEFQKPPVEVHQDCRKITDHCRGIYRIYYPNSIKGNRRMSTCNRLDLQTLGSQLHMPKNLPPITVSGSYGVPAEASLFSSLHVCKCSFHVGLNPMLHLLHFKNNSIGSHYVRVGLRVETNFLFHKVGIHVSYWCNFLKSNPTKLHPA